MKHLSANEKFKDTPAGRIPVDWGVARVRELGAVCAGRQRSPSYTEGKLVPYLRVANVFDGWISTEDVLQMKFTDAEFQRYHLKPGDILLNEGQSLELVGRSAIYRGNPPKCCFQNTLVRFRPNDDVDSEFMQLVFQRCLAQGRFAAIASKTTSIAHLGVSRFAHLRVVAAPIEEQKKIAEILSQWDHAIRLQEELIREKEERKRGLMQQLLTGKRRLPGFGGGWKKYRLGQVFRERTESGREDLPLLSITADRGVINRNEVDKHDTSNSDKSRYKRIAPGDIGYNTMRLWQGVSALSSLEGIISPAYTVVIPGPKLNADYVKQAFKLPQNIHLFFRYSQGLVNDTLNCKYKHFRLIHMSFPEVKEQEAIANILNECDKEVAVETSKRNELKTQKKGLMQKLLTGQVRVGT